MQKKPNIKLDKSRIGIISGIILLMAVLVLMFWLAPDNIADELILEAGSPVPQAAQFLVEDKGELPQFVTDLSTIDFRVPGDYPVELRYRDDVYESVIQVRDTVAPVGEAKNLAAYSHETVSAEDFITDVQDVTGVTVSYQKAPDMTKEGSRLIKLLLTDQGGNVTQLQAVLTVVFDSQGPELGGVDPVYTYLGTAPDYFASVTVRDAYDLKPRVWVDDSKADLNAQGIYDIVYHAVDEAGNENSIATTLTVTDDNVAPVIQGLHDMAIYAGSTISYSGIRVADDKDPNPTLTVDDSAVDLAAPGVYPLVCTARDMTGNVASRQVTVTVEEKPTDYVPEQDIYAAADRVLAKITTADMTDEAKVRAVYGWMRSNFTYAGGSIRTDWLQSGYRLMVDGRGDAFGFYGLGKLMLQRLGIENIDVRKVKNHSGDTDHYWSMVSLDGGESWYHFDATPYPWDPHDFCLVTDEFLDDFSASHKGYFNRDRSLYPETPKK